MQFESGFETANWQDSSVFIGTNRIQIQEEIGKSRWCLVFKAILVLNESKKSTVAVKKVKLISDDEATNSQIFCQLRF